MNLLSKLFWTALFLMFDCAWSAAFGAASGMDLPPDLPLPAAPPSRASWLRAAAILQPYGHSQFTALNHPGDRPARLRRDFGFNTLVILPPEAHNSQTEFKDHLTEEQFTNGVAAYRAADYKIILYTSVMACGLVPEFQSGELARAHPDWLQRDPAGNPVLVYGVPWLCPSTPARDYALKHMVDIVHRYHPDGILLDNNEFFTTSHGWTCHCSYCTAGFRQYVHERLGDAKARVLFGVAPEQLQIPSSEGPLYSLWLEWRNRVWAGINESFRARLREISPNAILFGNTQYMYDDGDLGTDRQYEHEDVLISESCNLNSLKMSKKMLLGQAVAGGRPLWNYIGTFIDNNDYTGLKPADVIAPLIAATLAHEARPWIVDGFDEGKTDPVARREMAALLGWHQEHPGLFANPPWTPVGVVFSLNSRNLLHRSVLPPHLDALLQAGVPMTGLRDDRLSRKLLKPFKVITVETAATLDPANASVLADWVRHGGVLIAASDTGDYDELGRKRGASVLWPALGLTEAPAGETSIDRGRVVAAAPGAFDRAAVHQTSPFAFASSAGAAVEIVPYSSGNSLVLQIARHEAVVQPVTIHLPAAFKPSQTTAQWFSPGSSEAASIPLNSGPDGNSFTLDRVPVYSAVKIALR